MTKRPTFLEKKGEETSVRKYRFLFFCNRHGLVLTDDLDVRYHAKSKALSRSTTVGSYLNELNEQLRADWLGA